jgi:hypothetical protein
VQEERQSSLKIANGAYFTDSQIARFLVQRSLIGWYYQEIKHTINDSLNNDLGLNFEVEIENLYKKTQSNFFERIQSIKILDPAVGSGVFLIEGAKILESLYVKYQSNQLEHFNEQELRIEIIKKHLFGWDINSNAIFTTKYEITQWILGKKNRIYETEQDLITNHNQSDVETQNINKHIESNFIICDTLLYNSLTCFSIIIGNPPFGNLLSSKYKKRIRPEFECRLSEISELFLEKSLSILEKSKLGILCFILPKTIAYYKQWEKSRKKIFANNLYEVIDLGIAFKKVNLEEIAIIVGTCMDKQENNKKNEKNGSNVHIFELNSMKSSLELKFYMKGIFPKKILDIHKIIPFSSLEQNQIK